MVGDILVELILPLNKFLLVLDFVDLGLNQIVDPKLIVSSDDMSWWTVLIDRVKSTRRAILYTFSNSFRAVGNLCTDLRVQLILLNRYVNLNRRNSTLSNFNACVGKFSKIWYFHRPKWHYFSASWKLFRWFFFWNNLFWNSCYLDSFG